MKIQNAVLLFISFAICIPVLIDISWKYSYVNTNPTRFSYTTCIISKIEIYSKSTYISFIYSTNSSDAWSETGEYKNNNKKTQWYKDYKAGDIGTCVRSSFTTNKNGRPKPLHDAITINNFMIHQDTTAMRLMTDGKLETLSAIIYLSAVLALLLSASIALSVGMGSDINLWYMGLMITSLWFAAAVIAGLPILIMGIIIEIGLNGPLEEVIEVNDVYKDVDGGCTIVGVLDSISYTDTLSNSFTLVKYGVETLENNFLAIATNIGQDADYLNTTATYDCSQNIYSKDIILDDYPTMKWLQPPRDNGSDVIAYGILLMLMPCILFCCMMCITR